MKNKIIRAKFILFYIVCVFLLLADLSFGAVFMTENFDAGTPPTGWNVVDNAGNGVVWTTVALSGETGNFTSGTNDCASVSSDAAGDVAFDTELETPILDFTDWTDVQLNYLANYQNLTQRDFLDVDISIDGGTTWSTARSWNEDHGAFQGIPGVPVSVDISAMVDGRSNVIIRFHYYDPTILVEAIGIGMHR